MTGVVCPDCPGVLEVTWVEDVLRFRCRIGHEYSLLELIEKKEANLEEWLRAAFTAFQELAQLCDDVVARNLAGEDLDAHGRRARAARDRAEELRALIEGDEPIQFGGHEPMTEAGP